MPLFIVLMTLLGVCRRARAGHAASAAESRRGPARPRDGQGARHRRGARRWCCCRRRSLGVAALVLSDRGRRARRRPVARRAAGADLSRLLRDRHRGVARRVGARALVAARADHSAGVLVCQQPRRVARGRRCGGAGCIRRRRPSSSRRRWRPISNDQRDDAKSGWRSARPSCSQRYNVDSVDALPIAFSGISLQEGEEHGNEVFDHHYGQLFDHYERQNRVSISSRASRRRCSRSARCRWAWPAPTSSSIATSSPPPRTIGA